MPPTSPSLLNATDNGGSMGQGQPLSTTLLPCPSTPTLSNNGPFTPIRNNGNVKSRPRTPTTTPKTPLERALSRRVSYTPAVKLTRTPCISWIFLCTFCYYQFTASLILNGMFAITESVAYHYNVGMGVVNAMGATLYILAALKFPAMFFIDRFGVAIGFYVGISFFLLGTIIRTIGKSEFSMVFLGTVICQLGQPFFQCLSASIPSLWFPKNRRATCTGLGVVSDFSGVGFGMFISGFFTVEGFVLLGNMMIVIGLLSAIPLAFFLENRGKKKRKNTNIDVRNDNRTISDMFSNPTNGGSPSIGGDGIREEVSTTPTELSTVALMGNESGNPTSGPNSRPENPASTSSRVASLTEAPVNSNSSPRQISSAPVNSNSSPSQIGYWKSLYMLFTEVPEFIWSFAAISILFGVFNGSLTVIDQVKPPKLKPGLYAGLLFLGGFFSNVGQGLLIDVGGWKYTDVIKGYIMGMFPTFLILATIWTMFPNFVVGLYISSFTLGLFGPGLAATCIGYICNSKNYEKLKRKIARRNRQIILLNYQDQQDYHEEDDDNLESNLESTVTGWILLGFCFVTAFLTVFLTPDMLGNKIAGAYTIPWIWAILAGPGFYFLFIAARLEGKTSSTNSRGNALLESSTTHHHNTQFLNSDNHRTNISNGNHDSDDLVLGPATQL